MLKMAGRWFKRWDKDANRFVSNLKEEYPDD
jgi:F-box protein 21